MGSLDPQVGTCPRVIRGHTSQRERRGHQEVPTHLVLGKEIWAVTTLWPGCYLYNTHLVGALGASLQTHNLETASMLKLRAHPAIAELHAGVFYGEDSHVSGGVFETALPFSSMAIRIIIRTATITLHSVLITSSLYHNSANWVSSCS